MDERTCEWCNESYQPKRRDQRTCSAVCRKRHNNAEQNAKRYAALPRRACDQCGTEYQSTRSDSRFCSTRCRHRRYYQDGRLTEHALTCAYCGCGFTWHNSRPDYCTDRCQQQANYARNRIKLLAHVKAWRLANQHTEAYRITSQTRYNNRRARKVSAGGPGISPRDWQRMLSRAAGRCFYCHAKRPLSMEHVIPLARGGNHSLGNVIPVCISCNSSKRDLLLVEWKRRQQLRIAACE